MFHHLLLIADLVSMDCMLSSGAWPRAGCKANGQENLGHIGQVGHPRLDKKLGAST